MLRELPGDRERNANDLVQVEMCGIVADEALGRVGG